ncbi:hypothetical protein G9C98_001286 [Cotesia typhae]|uniref:Uncharacterized protein n=1 Tax=Cotesia typhae TaxID=2053667 RepID=A0A8J5UVX8_9HYME|nr:hypothetical protein G9C98_001286 [Cotesia typhae]
MAPSITAIKAP